MFTHFIIKLLGQDLFLIQRFNNELITHLIIKTCSKVLSIMRPSRAKYSGWRSFLSPAHLPNTAMTKSTSLPGLNSFHYWWYKHLSNLGEIPVKSSIFGVGKYSTCSARLKANRCPHTQHDIHTYIHTHTHTYTHTYIHTHIHTHTHTHTHTHLPTYMTDN